MSLRKDTDLPMVYPILDTVIPSIPPRSSFYPLAPMGIGTPFVESLTSYICRLAATHYLSVGSLFEYVIVPILNKRYLKSYPGLGPASALAAGFRDRLRAINGVGKVARDWIAVVETLTLRNDLRFLTMSAISDAIPHWRLLRKFQAWCPACYEEMYMTNQIIYQPLIWSLTVVEICPRHNRNLTDQCPYCSRKCVPLTRRIQFGFCSGCGRWLGEPAKTSGSKNNKNFNDDLNWQQFVISNVQQLIMALPNMMSSIPKERIAESLRACVYKVTGGVITRFADLIGKPLITVYGWHHGKVRTPFYDLLRICYCLNLSVLDLLGGANVIDEKSLVVRELSSGTSNVKRRRPRQFNARMVEVQLKKYLKITPPISKSEAARRLGYDHTVLYSNFPELCREISKRYRTYMQNYYKTERDKRYEEVRQAVIHLYSQGIYVSPRPVAEYLNKPSYLDRRDIAIVIRETRELLDSQKNQLAVN